MSANSAAMSAANWAAWPARVPIPPNLASESVRVDFSGPVATLTVRDGEHWIAVHGRRDPSREAARSLEGLDLAQTSTIFAVGLGLGFLLDVLDDRGWTGKLVAFEPSAAFADACLRRRDCRAWLESGRLTILCAPDYIGLDAVVPTLDPNREDPVILVNPVVARIYAAGMPAALHRATRAWFGARANQEAKRRNGGRYLLNTLRNAQTLTGAADLRTLANRFTSIPALLVAAGPSLDRNRLEIARYRDRAVLIAVDTALRVLLDADIHPDFVVAVDPGEANARHLVDLPACPNTSLVTEGSVDPEAIQGFADRLFAFRVGEHQPWPWLREHGLDCGRLRAWGSVLTTAFDLALTMGCDPIVFTGADLGFTAGQPYARGTVYEEDWRREEAWGRTIAESWAARVAEWPETFEAGVANAPVRTAPHLIAFRDWLVAEAAKAAGRTIVNASGDGILQGAGVEQSSMVAVFAERRPVEALVRERTSAARASQASAAVPLATITIAPETMAEWVAFGRVSPAAIAAALDRTPDATVVEPAASAARYGDAPRPQNEPPPYPGLSGADAAYLATLARTHSLRLLPLRSADQPLAAEVAGAAATLTPGEALVIVDDVGIAVGAQVRRAVDAVLCARTDISLDYRRFADHGSRLSILRKDPLRPPGATGFDAVKWEPAHQPVAESLASVVMDHYRPDSVIDVGCGAGYWLRAFAGLGVSQLAGVTPRCADGAVHSGVRSMSIDDLLARQSAPHAGRFDVCLALEIAQELTPDRHADLIAACTRLSDIVIFSSRLPGAPDGSPFARPLPYWAELFWTQGYRLDDRLRPAVEERYGFPRTIYDVLVAFCRREPVQDAERAASADGARRDVLATAARLHDLYEQSIWWAVRANDLEAAARDRSKTTAVATRSWPIPPWRMGGEPGPLRRVLFRTDAARWYLTDPRAKVRVCEAGQVLPRFGSVDALAQAGIAGWVLLQDELTIRSSDGSDPRSNRRAYSVELPGFVAWAEAQPLAACLRDAL